MNFRSIILLTVLGLPAVALLAFGPRGKVDVPADRTVIRYWEKWSGVEGLAMKRIVDDFNRTVGRDEGIWVEYNAVSNVDQRTLIATAGGDPPDVAGLFDHIVAQFADQRALLELDELAAEFGIRPEQFKPIWWQIGQYKGRLYALPSAPYTIALHYNRRLFREAGLDPDSPPRSIAELDEYAARLTRKDASGRITQMGFTTSPAMLGWWHWVWPYFFGGNLWDGEHFTLDTPAGRAAMTWIAERRKGMGLAAALTFEATAGAIEGTQNPFLSEQLAMVFQGPWISKWVSAYHPDLDYGVAPFPSHDPQRQAVFASADVFAIPRGSRHVREAMVFLQYVLRQDVMEGLCKAHGKVSPYREPSPAFFEGHANPHIRVFDAMATSPETFGHPKMPTFSEASKEMQYMLETVQQGVRQPAEAVQLAQRKIETIVAAYDKMARLRRAAGGETVE